MIMMSLISAELGFGGKIFNFKTSDSNLPSFVPFVLGDPERHSLPDNQEKPLERGWESVLAGDCVERKEDEN